MIREAIVTTCNSRGEPHVAPMGYREEEDRVVLAPFRPSGTLDNLEATGRAVVNLTDNVAIFAGCLTGRPDWDTVAAEAIEGVRLADTLAHRELEVVHTEEDPQRPRLYCREVLARNHRPFQGFNRAQGAVLEAAVLVSRLHFLPREKVQQELDYLTIAMDKTAGPRERQAWQWLMEAVAAYYPPGDPS